MFSISNKLLWKYKHYLSPLIFSQIQEHERTLRSERAEHTMTIESLKNAVNQSPHLAQPSFTYLAEGGVPTSGGGARMANYPRNKADIKKRSELTDEMVLESDYNAKRI